MNKLLQYLISETNVEGRVLPGLQKMQRGGGNKTLPTAPAVQQLFGNNSAPINPTVPYTTTKNPADFYKSWIQSPEYARRQSNTGYSSSAKDESYSVPSASASRKARLESLNNIDPITYNTREASKATPGYYGGASSVNINPSDYIDTNRQMIEAHELGHIAGAAVNEGTSRPGIMSGREQDIFKSSMLPLREPTLSGAQGSKQREASRRSLEDFIHSQKPQEVKADLDALRFSMYDKGIYDIRKGAKFSELDFENAKQKFGQDRVFKRLENRVGKKNFVNLMNTIAQNDTDDSYSNIAAYGGPILDPRGQWAHPGKITRIPSDNITMQGVPYPVYGVGSNGQQQMMYPEQEYNFGGASYVDEYPMMQFGGGTLLGPLPMMSKIVPKVVSMFSGDPLKKFINWVNEPSETTGSTNRPSPLPVEAPVRTYQFDDTHSEYRDRANDVYSELKNNDKKLYNSSKPIKLSSGRFAGANVDPEMINDIVKAAKANNVDPWVMLSLVGRESTFGSGTLQNTLRAGDKQGLVSGWNVAEEYMPYEFSRFLADRQVPGVKVHKDNHGWQYEVKDKKAVDEYLKKNPQLIDSYYKKLEDTPDLGKLDSFTLAAQRIKKKGIQNYNPGDPKYSSMVNSDMGLLKQDAELKAYMKSKGYREGGQLGSGLLSKTVRCSSCGWSWKAADGGIDPLTCHKCGGVVKMQGGGTLPKMQMAGSLLQPINAQDASNVLSLFSVPQKAITKLFTGKYQTPSEAMGIKNPYGAFATDAILDPVNLVGAGILGNIAKASTKTGMLSKTYKINPLAKKKPDVILTRTQKPGQTDALRKFDEVEAKGLENPNFEERFEYKQRLKSPHLRQPFDQPGYGRGFSSDLGDISYYSYPNIQATRGYEGFPEILKTRISAKEAEKFNVGKNPLQGYISFAPKREYLLPKDMLYSAESFIPNKGYSAGPQGATEPGSIRDFVKKAYAEQTAANIPNWLTGYPSGKLPNKKTGGQHGGLDRWFAEKWVDVKTGKDCGRQEGESRAGYPACRPSKRVNSQTPKTSSEMSSAEKAKFKSSKTSSQRIDYNHKRNK